MVWDTARKAGWLPESVTPVHVQIGNVLGEDRKILRTRSGAPLRLLALLDEAEAKARARDRRGPAGPRRGDPRRDRPAGRHRCGEVRRPVGRARQRVRLRPRPDGRPHRQHRPLPAVRRRADPLDLPLRRTPSRRRPPPITIARAGRAGAGPQAARVRRRRRGGRRPRSSRTDCALPLRARPSLLGVLRAVSGAQGRDAATRDVAARAVCAHAGAVVTGLDLLGIESPEQM